MSYSHINRYLPRANTLSYSPNMQQPLHQPKPNQLQINKQLKQCSNLATKHYHNNLNMQVNNIDNISKQINQLLYYIKDKDKSKGKYIPKMEYRQKKGCYQNKQKPKQDRNFGEYRQRILELQRLQEAYQEIQIGKKQNVIETKFQNRIYRHKKFNENQRFRDVNQPQDQLPISRPSAAIDMNISPVRVQVDYRNRSPFIVPRPNLKYLNKLINQPTYTNKNLQNNYIKSTQKYSPFQRIKNQSLTKKQIKPTTPQNIKQTIKTTNYSYNLKFDQKYIEEQSNQKETERIQQKLKYVKYEEKIKISFEVDIKQEDQKKEQGFRQVYQIRRIQSMDQQNQSKQNKRQKYYYTTQVQEQQVIIPPQRQQNKQINQAKEEHQIDETQKQINPLPSVKQRQQINPKPLILQRDRQSRVQIQQDIDSQPMHPYRFQTFNTPKNIIKPTIVQQNEQINEFEQQPIAPYRTDFQIKIYPCDLNQSNIKTFIADRLATVIRVDVQQLELKAIFIAGRLGKNMSFEDKKRKLLRMLWQRNLMVDQNYLDYSMKLNPQVKPNQEQIEKIQQKYKNLDEILQSLVDKHLQGEYQWQKKVLQMITSHQIEQTSFKPGYLDLQNKGYLKIQDLTCFINLNATGSPCFKNKHSQKLFSRFCRAELNQDRLSYAAFMGALVRRI